MDAVPFELYAATDEQLRHHALALSDAVYAGGVSSCPVTGIAPPDRLRGIAPAWWRRQLRRAQARHVSHSDAQLVGGVTNHSYAPPRLVKLYTESQDRQRRFLSSGYVAKAGTAAPAFPLSRIADTPHRRYSRHLAFVDAVETLASEEGYSWIMLTATLEPEWHPNPTHGKQSWNRKSLVDAYRVLSARFAAFRRGLDDMGYRAVGLAQEEPQGDGTPHLHIALAIPPSRSVLHRYCDVAIASFGGRLKVITGVGETLEGAYYADGSLTPCSVDASARLTVTALADVEEEAGAAKLSSYLSKYLQKGAGFSALDPDMDADSSLVSILAHRYGVGAQSIRWLGLPPGVLTVWGLARSVNVAELDPGCPPFARALIDAAQLGMGATGDHEGCPSASDGVYEFLALLGGLQLTANARRSQGAAWHEARPLYETATNRYGEAARKLAGFQVLRATVVRERRLRKSGVSAGKPYFRTTIVREQVWVWRKESGYELCATRADADALSALPESRETDLASSAALTVPAAGERPWAIPAYASALVEAPAGSGKTHSIVERARILHSKGVRPDRIKVVSFTRDSAFEVSERLSQSGLPFISATTMHAAAREHLWSLGEDPPADFDGQIRESTARATRSLHVLVDEVQDLSADQLDWLDAHALTIFAVGDPSQGLYVWRGADHTAISRIREMVRERTTPQLVLFDGYEADQRITVNRRSASAVVGLGDRIAGRSSLSLRSGGSTRLVETWSSAAYVAEILRLAQQWSDGGSVLVLTRSNSSRAEIRLALEVASLPGIDVMTIHAAKGLEADRVIVAAGPPSAFARDDQASLENLLYVGVTRARADVALVTLGASEARIGALLG